MVVTHKNIVRSRTFERSRQHGEKAHQVIPGGAHTYAKGDDQYPQHMLPYIQYGKAAHVWDLDGNEYIEYGAGLRAVTLGHAYEPVLEAARKQMVLGSNFCRPARIELDCALKLQELIPSAEMVKFAKHGSDCTSAAVKLSRAYTGRDMVAICGDHPFFSVDDWFIGTTATNAGIPQCVRDLTVKFKYNDLASVAALFEQYPGKIACVITEAETTESPRDDFLNKLQDLCHRNGAVFVLDETITGFRWHKNGAQHVWNIKPDLSTFGKAMGNGFSISALVGKKEIMNLGGINHDQDRVFLLSTTHGGETHCLAAAIEVMKTYQKLDVVGRMEQLGKRLADGVNTAAKSLGIADYFHTDGRSSNLIYVTKDAQHQRSQPFRTLFIQELVKNGILAPNFVVHAGHTEADIDETIEIVSDALHVYRNALEDGVEKHLQGRPVKPVFRRKC